MITAAEYQQRMQQLQRAVGERGLDVFLVSAEESIYYLTGVSYKPLERPFFIIVRSGAEPVLLVPALEGDHLSAAPNVSRVERYWDYPSPPGQGWPERLAELLGDGSVGVEPALTQEVAEAIRSLAPQVLPLVEGLRKVKSPAEVEMIRRAAFYSDFAVERVIGASYYGVSMLELFSQGRAVQTRMIKEVGYGALDTNILAAAWPAPLSAQPHGVPHLEDRLREGPHIALALLRVNGYAAECERTYFLTPPSASVKAAFAAMTEARQRAFALVRPGVPCAEIDLVAKEFLQAEGYRSNLLHRTGHGFGLGNHEAPWVADGSEEVLAENMVISVEPGIYLPEVGGVRHSDTVLVTKTGYECLTRYPVDLASVTVKGRKPLARLMGGVVRKAVGWK